MEGEAERGVGWGSEKERWKDEKRKNDYALIQSMSDLKVMSYRILMSEGNIRRFEHKTPRVMLQFGWHLRFSRRRVWRWLSSGLLGLIMEAPSTSETSVNKAQHPRRQPLSNGTMSVNLFKKSLYECDITSEDLTPRRADKIPEAQHSSSGPKFCN
jgi:hypothetical protein